MVTYEYQCDACNYHDEFSQSILEALPQHCPRCSSIDSFYQIYDGNTFISIKGNITTVGQQAELNAKKLGKEQVQKITEENQIENIRKKQKNRKLPKGAKSLQGNYKRPWWRDTDKIIDVNKIKNKEKYIKEGKE